MKALTSLPEGASALEALPLSLLNDLLYCPRRAALKVVEGWRAVTSCMSTRICRDMKWPRA
jgi:hypothetical protein